MMSYHTWSALNNGDNSNDFQKIARDSNFQFNTHKGRVNWNQIDKLNIDRLIDEQNVTLLGTNINNVVNFDIESEFDVRILNSNFVKIFKLSQLTNDFLLHCKRHLSQQNFLLKTDLEKASKKLVLVKKENVELKKIIHWNKWRPASCSGEGRDLGENAMCEICGKLFQFESYLVMHLNRRHPGVVNHQMRSQESYMQNFEKEPGECGEVSPPSGGVPGGGTTSKNRDHRYTAELESLRKLITSKLSSTSTAGTSTKVDKPESFPEDHSETTIGKQHDLKVINEEQRETRSQQDLREEPTKMTAEEGAKVEMTSPEDAKISKEEYERQFSTMENAWRKQFEELDKKYQNEIKKLQEELKKAMEQNQNNCKKLILEQNEKDHTNEEENKQVTEKRKMDNFETEFIRRMCLYDEDRFIDIKIQGKNQEKGKQMNEEEIQMNKCKNPESEEEVEIGVTENTPRKEIKTDSPHGNLSNNQEKTHLNASKKFNYRLDLSRAAKEHRDEDEQNTEQLKNMLANSSRDKRTSFLTYVVDSHVQQELSNVKKLNTQQSIFDLNRSKPAFGDLIAQNKKEQDTVKDQSKDTKEKSAIVKVNNDKQKDTENDQLKTKKFDVPYAQKFNDQEIPSDSVGKIILKNNRSMDQTNYMEPNRYESNHTNSLDYLNQNDELTKNQMDDIIADSNKINVNKDLFFTDMDHNIFDFKGESSRKNTGFYNDNFAKNISQLVTINSKEIKRTFHDKTFKIGEKSFVHDGDGITNLLNNVKRGTQADKSKPTRMTEIGSLISKLDDKPVDTIKNIDESKVKTVKFASEIETKDDTLSEPTRDKPSETIPFQGTQLDLEEENFTHQTIKHSEKYFGDISRVKRTESQDDPSIISTDSSSEIFDKVLNVTNPDNQFYYEMVETSTSESSQCRDEVSNEALTAPMTAISREQIIRPVGKTSRAKDLSIIEEETETDSSSIPSIKIDKIIPRQTMYVDSSSDDSTIQDISSEPENENFKKPKLLPDNILADLSKRVQDIEEIVDGQFKDIREQDSESTLIYWDGENRPRERQAEARSTFDKLANLTNNTTTVTIHKAPVKETKSTKETPQIEEKRDISGTPPKTEGKGETSGKVDKDEKVNEGKANVFKDDSTVDNSTTTNLEKRLAKRDEVVTKFEKVMKKFNLNPEWLTLPENTFEQKMQIIVHDRTLKTKAVKNYESIKNNIKRRIESICKDKMKSRTDVEVNVPSNNKENDGNQLNEKHEDKTENYVRLKVRITNKKTGDQKEELEKISDTRGEIKDHGVKGELVRNPTLRSLTDKNLINVLSQNFSKTNSDTRKKVIDSNKEYQTSPESSMQSFINNSDLFSIETPSLDLNTLSKITTDLQRNDKVLGEVVNVVSKTEMNVNDSGYTGSKAESRSWQTTSSNERDSKDKPGSANSQQTISALKQAFESRLTKHMYADTDDDILDREPDYLQTNNFTSKQSIGKTRSRGYNFFGKSKKTAKSCHVKEKSSDSESTDSKPIRTDRKPTQRPQSAREHTSHGDNKSITDQDLFLIKAPYDILSSNSESNFQIRQPNQKQATSSDRIHPSENNSSIAAKRRNLTVSNQNHFNHVNLATIEIHKENSLLRPISKSADNYGANSSAYIVPNERKVGLDKPNERKILDVTKLGDVPMSGTIRGIVNAIHDDSDSSSSFELDEFLEKNNIG